MRTAIWVTVLVTGFMCTVVIIALINANEAQKVSREVRLKCNEAGDLVVWTNRGYACVKGTLLNGR